MADPAQQVVTGPSDQRSDDVLQRLRALQDRLAQRDVPGDVVEELEICAEAVEELDAERARFRMLFEAAPIARLSTDPTGMIQEANQAAWMLFGLCRERLVGTPLSLLVVPPCRDAVQRALADATARRPAEFVVVLARRTKRRRQVALRGVTAHAPSARGSATVQWTARNVTAAERRQASLEHALANERTISQDLRAMNDQRGAFLLAIAPDLLSPLTALLGRVRPPTDRRASRSTVG